MRTIDSQAVPRAPSLIESLRAGFDAITNHIELILFPVVIDLLLWLGPHLPMTQVILSFSNRLIPPGIQDPNTIDLVRAFQEIWDLIAERFNLLSLLRSYPVGIPSLMAGRLPVETPAWLPLRVEIHSMPLGMLLWLLITAIGIIAGTLYFMVVSQAALSGLVSWQEAFSRWLRASKQVGLLTLIWLGLLVTAAIPGVLIVGLAALVGLAVGQCAALLYAGFLVWIIFPLVFSPHGIFVNEIGAYPSLKSSALMTRYTLPTTTLFILVIILLSKGLDLLWQVPAESSWLALIGIAGHAFVTTGLLAASFVYYRDADIWAQSLVRHIKFSAIHKT